ncbi:Cacna1s [Symbiodinium sp. CCMP2592]|nr:Cacna1s [Symbiodinium sp. CCMP2592]
MTKHILDRDAFAEHLDASWQTFRKRLLEVYPNGPSLQTVEPFPPIIGHTFEEALEGAPVDLDSAAHAVADTARQISDEVGAESKAPTDEIAVRTGSISPSIDSDVVRQGYSGHLLQSGLRGLSEEDVAAVKDRMRLRLGILSPKTLVSGKALLESVSALGLTRYTEEDMNEFVNMLGDFVQLEFVTKPERRPSQNSVTMNTMLFGAQEVMEIPECKLGKPKWQWPSATATRDLPTMRASFSLKGGGERVCVQPSRRTTTYDVIPAQPLLDIFLAQETEVHRRIFGAKGLNQYRAIKEILVAGDTNRLVAELTFVRINDLAAPPEPMHPIMYLEPLVAVLIIGNGIMIGFQTDPNYKDWDGWVYIEMAFAVCLILEVCLRMYVLGCFGYWCGSERLWNWFDLFLMCTGLSDIAIQLFDDQESGMAGTSLLRFCRLIRLVRIVKVFRIKFMKDLRLMVKGLLAGIRTLALAFVLLFAVLYVISGFTTMTIGSSEITDDLELTKYFDNIPNSMFTTFRCFTGECVNDDGRPIHSLLASRFGLPFIAGYVASYMLVTMGIFNVILAVYVDITMKAAKENDAVTAEQYSRESIRVARTTRELLKKFAAAYHSFHEPHQNHHHGSPHDEHDPEAKVNTSSARALYTEDGMHDKIAITKDLFLLIVQDRGVQKLMDDLDLPHDRANLFEIIDADGSGTLQITELLQGLLKIRGEISKSDTVASLLATKAVFSMLSELKEEQLKELKSMRAEFARYLASFWKLKQLPLTPEITKNASSPAKLDGPIPVLGLDQVGMPSKPEACIEDVETAPPVA